MMGRAGEKVILLREETKPEDIHGFFAAQGILTSRGGKTSHAAVVARGMGKACVAGAEDIKIDVRSRQAMVGNVHIQEGDIITMQEIFVFEKLGVTQDGKVMGRFRATGVRPKCAERLRAAGIHLPPDMFEGVTEVR